MWYAAVIRFIRRRLVLGIIFASSLTYCVVSLLRDNNQSGSSGVQDIVSERKHPFIWRSLQEHNESFDSVTCRNSVQGKVLIVDDRGYACHRTDLQRNGCCDRNADSSKRYQCETCSDSGCCAIYEYCVSCCLHPNKKDILEIVLTKLSVQENVLFTSVNDHYELCLAKCRTNSQSVQHENSYRDPKAKHCYGDEVPGTHKTVDGVDT